MTRLFAWLRARLWGKRAQLQPSPASISTPLGCLRRVDSGVIISWRDIERARRREYALPIHKRRDG